MNHGKKSKLARSAHRIDSRRIARCRPLHDGAHRPGYPEAHHLRRLWGMGADRHRPHRYQAPVQRRRMGLQVIQRIRELIAWDGPRAIAVNTTGILTILSLLPTEKLPLLPVRSLWAYGFGILPYSA